MFAGLKKCMPTTSCARAGDARYGVNIESRGVGREQRARATAGIEFAKYILFELQALEDGFDHEIGCAERGNVGRRENARLRSGARLRGEAALFHGAIDRRANSAHAFLERGHLRVNQRDVKTARCAARGDAAAHGAGANDGNALYVRACLAHER